MQIVLKVATPRIVSISLFAASTVMAAAFRQKRFAFAYAIICMSFSLALVLGVASVTRAVTQAQSEGPKILWLESALARVRERIVITINHALPRADAALLSGMLIGARESMPHSLRSAFSAVGITHIVAVSGYNITIVASALFTAFLALGFRRKESAAWVVLGVALFVLLCGASAATVRAGVMGIAAICAQLAGRRTHADTLLLVTAAVMALVSPRVLTDVGFQLSFAALAGLLYIAPLIQRRTQARGMLFMLRSVMIQTFSAQAAAIPLVLWYFDSISLISPLANLLIVPIVPLVMGIGAAATALGALGDALGASANALSIVWALPWLMLEYIIRTSSLLAGLPFASLIIQSPIIKTLFVFGWYATLIGIVLALRHRQRIACMQAAKRP